MKSDEPKFLCQASMPEDIVPLLRQYTNESGDEITFEIYLKYQINYRGKLTKKRLNELRIFALGCWFALRSERK